MTDILGNEITPGVLLTYPSRYSSSIWLKVMRVESVEPERVRGTLVRETREWGADTGKKVFITPASIKRSVVVQEPPA